VNALEYILIPSLNNAKKEITFKLDELERGSFTTLRAVKAHLEKIRSQS
jgi:vacuolar-type H+-ATPase subunit D/Vma8